MKDNLLISSVLYMATWMICVEGAAADVTLEAKVSSVYVDRGLELADFTFHPSVEVSSGSLYGGIWSALPFEDDATLDVNGDQVDFYAGYGLAVGEKFALDAGGKMRTRQNGSDSFEAYAGIAGELGTFSPSLYVYRDFDLENSTIEAATGLAIPLQGFPLEATGRLGLVDGGLDYFYYGLDLIYPIELSDSALLSFGVHYSDNDIGGGVPDNKVYGSASVRMSF